MTDDVKVGLVLGGGGVVGLAYHAAALTAIENDLGWDPRTAAFWIAAGASPSEIARRAGHTSVSVVLDRYGHLLPAAADG